MDAQAIGESCLLWRLGRGPSVATTDKVRRLAQRLRTAAARGQLPALDVVPSYDSLAVHFDPLGVDPSALGAAVTALLHGDAPGEPARGVAPPATVTLPTLYRGPDLAHVAQQRGLTAEAVVRRHTAPTYVVAAIGFLPHFPYLLGLDPALATPRRATPRPRVPAGAVAIGNDQAGVYPRPSPGGWNLIGQTNPALLTALRPGDRVRFEATADPEKADSALFAKQESPPAPEAGAPRGAPPRLRLNIDLGERGADHPTDAALAAHADLINLACGGHAGDGASIARFSALARRHGATLTAHLSYPDPDHFGRRPMAMAFDDLARSLDAQRARLPGVDHVKLHGALYHAADTDPALARPLARWLQRAGFTTVLTPDPGALAHAARERGLSVLAEAFADRRYARAAAGARPALLPRSHRAASLTALPDALAQARRLIAHQSVVPLPDGPPQAVRADTLCIHSDNPIALGLAAALAAELRRGRAT